jgi:hypothetical protein
MIDPFLIFAALVVLPLVLLFRFMGCDKVFGLRPVDPPEAQLVVKVRVPTALTVNEIRFRVIRPNGAENVVTQTDPMTQGTADGDNLFTHSETPEIGTWMVNCRLDVTDSNGISDPDQDAGDFLLEDTDTAHEATFQATGTPSDGNFNVVFVGLS